MFIAKLYIDVEISTMHVTECAGKSQRRLQKNSCEGQVRRKNLDYDR